VAEVEEGRHRKVTDAEAGVDTPGEKRRRGNPEKDESSTRGEDGVAIAHAVEANVRRIRLEHRRRRNGRRRWTESETIPDAPRT
jgi:hypothetical protein